MRTSIMLRLLPEVIGAMQVVGESVEHLDGGFGPFLVMIIFLGLAMVFFIIGVVAGVIIAGCTVLLAALGIVSSSALVGVCSRRVSLGIRALHYQVVAMVSVPGGIGLLALGLWLLEREMSRLEVVLIGGGCGLLFGLVCAMVLDRFALFLHRRLVVPTIRG